MPGTLEDALSEIEKHELRIRDLERQVRNLIAGKTPKKIKK